MRIPPTLLAAMIATNGALACSSEPVTNPGVAGAGVKTEIVGITHDSTGYTVKLQIANRDTAAIGYRNYCPGSVEIPSDSGWVPLTVQGQCLLSLEVVPPGVTVGASIPRQALTPGTVVRVSLNWNWAYGRHVPWQVSTTDPVMVR
jgi:hypothetical protein